MVYAFTSFFLAMLPWWRPQRNTHLDAYFAELEAQAAEQAAMESRNEAGNANGNGNGNGGGGGVAREDANGVHLHQD